MSFLKDVPLSTLYFLFLSTSAYAGETALDRYIQKPDDHYTWYEYYSDNDVHKKAQAKPGLYLT